MTSGKVSLETGAALRTVNKYAAENGIRYTGEGRRKTYIWTEEEKQMFINREKPGRPRKIRSETKIQ
ncbi:hypothetical protein AGMMS49579_04320 [Spirochaetia bacterium]|nr:hypothetical protein AGMMS49579_04320 [Spirochaetia bacterium]